MVKQLFQNSTIDLFNHRLLRYNKPISLFTNRDLRNRYIWHLRTKMLSVARELHDVFLPFDTISKSFDELLCFTYF